MLFLNLKLEAFYFSILTEEAFGHDESFLSCFSERIVTWAVIFELRLNHGFNAFFVSLN